MSFCEVNPQCEASGEGLTSAQVGVWNRFVIAADCAGPGALHVVIQEANSEERVSSVVIRLTPTLLEVHVLLTTGTWQLFPFHCTSVGGGSHSRKPIPSQMLLSCDVLKYHKATPSGAVIWYTYTICIISDWF